MREFDFVKTRMQNYISKPRKPLSQLPHKRKRQDIVEEHEDSDGENEDQDEDILPPPGELHWHSTMASRATKVSVNDVSDDIEEITYSFVLILIPDSRNWDQAQEGTAWYHNTARINWPWWVHQSGFDTHHRRALTQSCCTSTQSSSHCRSG